ncbi:MAG: 2-haloacid dehalogenase [Thermoleophilaceae bacterium]|nr:2-haloacid dehalogenase [Thermoleophilaceae bacterium]
MSEIRVATFDCYGTLIDWEGGVGSFLYELARRHEHDPPPARELRERWEALQFERIQGGWRSYREILADSLAEWEGERGYRYNEHDGEALARSMECWQPFPDAVPALRAARAAGLRLWIISNTDRAIIDHSLQHLEVEFDGVTVAEDCRAYKPSTLPFERALREIGGPHDQILHVAFGFKYDIGPAQRLGLRTAWVNRKQEQAPGPEQADHVWSDLWPLAGVAGA